MFRQLDTSVDSDFAIELIVRSPNYTFALQ